MKGRKAKILACSMVVMLLASGMPENLGYKAGISEKNHTAYAAVTGYITSYNDLIEATATGGVYVLSNSIVLTSTVIIPEGVDLTLLQENGRNNKITSVNYSEDLLRVSEGGSLTLGSKDTDPIYIDGSNLTEGNALITSDGTITIENADISCKKGGGIVVWESGRLYMNGGYIHDCEYRGVVIHGEGSVLSGGTIDNCGIGVLVGATATNCKITGGTISNAVYYGIQCVGKCTMTGGVVSECDTGVYTKSASSSFTMNGGIVSNSKLYALDPAMGAIYLLGGNIQNSRCTTRTGSSFYIGGKPYLDDNSFIIVREDAPLVQIGNLSAPAANPYAKLQLYGLTTEQPLVTALSESVSLPDSSTLYQTYDRDFWLSVKENQIYMEGTKEIDTKVYPTVRPGSLDTTEQPLASIAVETMEPVTTETPLQTSASPTATVPVTVSDSSVQSSMPQTTTIPPAALETPATTDQPSVQTPGGINVQEPVATQNVYGEFSSARPEITKISAKGLHFQLQWKFSSVVPVKEYVIYGSSDQKKYSLIKKVDAATTTTSVSVSKAYTGKKIYFYVVARATDSASGKVYQSDKSYVASKYLINKVTGTTGSYHTSTQKLVVKWKKVSNCTGYCVYIKAYCNGKTLNKRCATVSKTKNMVSISTRKIKRKFSSNGKPIRIKKYTVRAFYKKGKKTAYSPI